MTTPRTSAGDDISVAPDDQPVVVDDLVVLDDAPAAASVDDALAAPEATTVPERQSMNGAQALIRTLVDAGVDTCFMNPGTSEMHFVAALDAVAGMRGVLALFEGVATGAADGFARMADRPAATLLHLGPGLGNGLANLHNARKGRVPIVNIVGDHATHHKPYNAQLESDIETVARNVSTWVRTSQRADDVAADAAEAVAVAQGPPGQVATLILPADASWSESSGPVPPAPPSAPEAVPAARIDEIARVLRSGETCLLLLGGRALRAQPVLDASSIAGTTGCRTMAETFPARVTRGAGLPEPTRLAYLAEYAQMQLADVRHLILVDAASPVSFFAYPGLASDLVPETCQVHTLAAGPEDVAGALAALAAAVGAPADAAEVMPLDPPPVPTGSGPLDVEGLAAVVGALLPEDAIVSDESTTAGMFITPATARSPRHDWLCLTGGSIGQGLPVAVGAAVACPDRPVVALESDGSAAYTIQALWTMAREQLDVTTILINNRSYAILNMELDRVGASAPGPKAKDMLDLTRPNLDFVAIADGFGVPAARATTIDELVSALREAFAAPGPHLIEAIVPSIF